MKMSKYLELVKKFQKEEENLVVKAQTNAPILKLNLQAKVKVLEGNQIAAEAALQEAEGKLERAKANVTRQVEAWLNGVESAQVSVDNAAEDLKDIQYSIDSYTEYIALF